MTLLFVSRVCWAMADASWSKFQDDVCNEPSFSFHDECLSSSGFQQLQNKLDEFLKTCRDQDRQQTQSTHPGDKAINCLNRKIRADLVVKAFLSGAHNAVCPSGSTEPKSPTGTAD
jgi:hypothetical protein